MRLEPIERPAAMPMTDIDTISDHEAEIGAKAIVKLFRRWNLTDIESCTLLGGMSLATYSRWKRGEFGRIGVDLRTRLSALLGIHKSLRIIFTENNRAYSWIKKPNAVYNGQRALDIMMRGQLMDILRVRHYLDVARG